MKNLLSMMLMNQDKANHAFWTLFGYVLLASVIPDWRALLVAGGVAIAKEMYDYTMEGYFDFLDICYSAAAPIIVYLVTKGASACG